MSQEYDMLTVLQPWASALMFGPKRVENRNWQPNSPLIKKARSLVGQRIAIHAGKQWYEGLGPPRGALASGGMIHGWTYRHDETMPLGAVLGTMRLDAVLTRSETKMWEEVPVKYEWVHSHLWAQTASSVWLVMSDPQPFSDPIPARGMQGWWKWKGVGA